MDTTTTSARSERRLAMTAKRLPRIMLMPSSHFKTSLPVDLRPAFDALVASAKARPKEKRSTSDAGCIQGGTTISGLVDAFCAEIYDGADSEPGLPESLLKSTVRSRRVKVSNDQGPMDMVRLDELNEIYSWESEMLHKANRQITAAMLANGTRKRMPNPQLRSTWFKGQLQDKVNRFTMSTGLTSAPHTVESDLGITHYRLVVLETFFEMSPYPNAAEIGYIGITINYGDAWGLERWFAAKRKSRGFPDKGEVEHQRRIEEDLKRCIRFRSGE